MFNPVQIADDLKKTGGYIRNSAGYVHCGISGPHNDTDHTGRCDLPDHNCGVANDDGASIQHSMDSGFVFGGTSILIIVGVMLDTMRQVESHLIIATMTVF